MECNKDEAIRAKEIAEKKMENNDFAGAQRIALKAQNLYPELENITQLRSICDVHCSAQSRLLGSEKDWYAILQVENFADELVIKKQYRRLALILHPDKNRFPGAEGAFKLICEANAVLSDPTKKSLYDNKIRVSVRSAPGNPPAHHLNKNSQLNRQYGSQDNVPNGFSSLNQHQATWSTSSVRQEGFWTNCPYCGVRYQYHRQFINKSLRCPTCSKLFTGYDIGAQGKTSGSKLGQAGAQHVPSRPDSSRPAAFQEKKVPNQGSSKMGVQSNKGSSASHAGSQGTTSRKSVRPEPGIRTGSGSEGIQAATAANVSEGLQSNQTDTCNVNSSHGEAKVGKSNGDAINTETEDLKNKSRKRGRKLVVESSDSSYASGHSDREDVTMKGDFGDPATDLKSKSGQVRRSSRKRQHVSYNETDDDFVSPLKRGQPTKEDNGKDQKYTLDNKNSKHGNQHSFPTHADYSKSETKAMGNVHSAESLQDKGVDFDKEGKAREESGGKSCPGADTVEIEIDPDQDSIYRNSPDKDLYDCPDPEFSDFDKERDESRFGVDQFWACYDTLDGMPRFYAKVKKVCLSPFELIITWLEADPIDKAYKKWVAKELPAGCGSFKLGRTEKTDLRLSFSHQVHCEKSKKRGKLFIYPREGEVWALLKDWDLSWISDPENHKEFKYEIVEVLSDFVAGIGIKVCDLDKVKGFVSLFQRATQSESNSYFIGPNELYKFSHRVPCFKMTGSERGGVPMGSYELDPACLPLNPGNLCYPSKAKLECRNMDPEVHCLPPKSGKEKDNSVVSEGTSTPKKFVDLEGIRGNNMSILRRSPRGLNVRRSAN